MTNRWILIFYKTPDLSILHINSIKLKGVILLAEHLRGAHLHFIGLEPVDGLEL